MLELSGTALGPMKQAYGGDTFNTAVYLSRCGGAHLKVCYATALGDDALSQQLERRWVQDGLDLGLVRHIPGRMPGIYQIAVDAQGERHFSFWRENSAARAYFDTDLTPLEQRCAEWDGLYFSGISLAILPPEGRTRVFALAKELRKRGAVVAFDNNYRPRLWPDIGIAREAFKQAFDVAHTLLITADDHQVLFGFEDMNAALADARALPAPELVIKRGASETLVRTDNLWVSVPTVAVHQVVDTTAAGDSFAAGYLSHRLRDVAPDVAAAFGNRLAARVIQHPGAIIPLAAMSDLVPA